MNPLRITTRAAVLAMLALMSLPPTVSPAQEAPAPPSPIIAPPSPVVPPSPGTGLREPAGNVIVVTGQGSVDAVADVAIVGLGFQVTRPTAQEAQDQSSATMDRVIRQITALGIPREKIRTTIVSLFPVRRSAPPSAEITGYTAINNVMVTVDDLRLTGRAIDTAVAAGANTVNSLTFGLRDPSSYRIRALRTAVERARTTAAAIASAAGVSNLRVVRIEEIGPVPIPRVGLAAPAIQGAETPVMPGTLTVTVLVRAVYAF